MQMGQIGPLLWFSSLALIDALMIVGASYCARSLDFFGRQVKLISGLTYPQDIQLCPSGFPRAPWRAASSL